MGYRVSFAAFAMKNPSIAIMQYSNIGMVYDQDAKSVKRYPITVISDDENGYLCHILFAYLLIQPWFT